MSSTYGERFRLTVFGQSHSPAIGVTIEGLPAGLAIDMERLQGFLARRAPGGSPLATARKEADVPKFVSGLVGNHTCGTPLTAIIENTNTRSGDYENLRDCPRPGHADYPAQVKYGGHQDVAGGGHFSGRMTAPLCIAGGICIQLLEQLGVTVGAHIQSIETVCDDRFDPVNISAEVLQALGKKPLPVLHDPVAEQMQNAILRAKEDGDSVGGVIEVAVTGLPVGWGDPMFGGLENRIAQAVFGVPAIRGIEFGLGFEATKLRGSVHNDPYTVEQGQVRTVTNNHGGILGGISTAMPLVFRVAVKPTPSIYQPQRSVSLRERKEVSLQIQGRHDPCIVPRAVPVLEAVTAIALYDSYLCAR